MKAAETALIFKELGPLSSGCKAKAKAKQKLCEKTAQKHAKQFGRTLGVSAADLLWGLGTVQSRAYIGQDSSKMFPMIDLCNHSQHAATVEGIEMPNGATYVRGTIKQYGQPVMLPAGQELLLNYGAKATYPEASDCFVNYGFVPEEYAS